MQLSHEEIKEGVVKIILSGRMDMQGVEAIKGPFENAVKDTTGSLIVDMSDVPYMSSIGIRCLLINAKSVKKRGGQYFIAAPQNEVKSVLEMSGIDQIIAVYDSFDLALSSL